MLAAARLNRMAESLRSMSIEPFPAGRVGKGKA